MKLFPLFVMNLRRFKQENDVRQDDFSLPVEQETDFCQSLSVLALHFLHQSQRPHISLDHIHLHPGHTLLHLHHFLARYPHNSPRLRHFGDINTHLNSHPLHSTPINLTLTNNRSGSHSWAGIKLRDFWWSYWHQWNIAALVKFQNCLLDEEERVSLLLR